MLDFDDLPRRAGRAARAAATHRGGAAVRRPDQHPVHERHDRRAEGRDAHAPQHRQQRLLRRRGACGSPSGDRLCIPVPLYHCFGMVMGNLGCVTQAPRWCIPARRSSRARARGGRGRALHGALRRADDVHRRARPSAISRVRPVVAAHRHHGRRAVPGRGDEAGRRAHAHAATSRSPTA